MIPAIRATLAAFRQQWSQTASSIMNLSFLIGAIPTVAVIAWVAIRSNSPDVLTYLLIGAPLVGVWNGVIFRVGWSLNEELTGRTLEFALISRTPLILVMLGKSLAQLAYGIPAGIVSVITMLIVIRQFPTVASVPSLIISMVLVLIGLAASSLLLAPLMVLVGGRAGFFNAIMALGVMASGFLFPIDQLPFGFEVVSRLLPTSWAMSGVWQSIVGAASIWSLLGDWAACLLTTSVIYVITYLMFRAVEKRIRVTGVLGTY
jgi:ABC-2 type transport system permease protein